MLKKILEFKIFIQIISWLIAQYMKFVFYTTKWTKLNWEIEKSYQDNKKPIIACFWHNRLLMQTFFWERSTSLYMLISSHQDGQLISKTISHFNVKTIQGSSSKGGTQALKQMITALKRGDSVGVTPDGPRGPRFMVKAGIIQMAKLSGADIIPCAYSISKRKIFPSWDRFIFAFPFGRGAIVLGNPIKPPISVEDFESVRLKVEKSLIEVSDKADEICGHLPLR